MKDIKWKEILIALSVANLLFIAGWRKLLYPTDPIYNIKFFPTQIDFIAILLVVIINAVIFVGSVWLSRYLNKGKVPIFFKLIYLFAVLIAFLGVAITIIKTQFWIVTLIGRNIVLGICLVLLIGGIILLIKQYKHIVAYANVLMLIFAPMIFVTFSQSIIRIVNPDTSIKRSDFVNPNIPSKESKPEIKSRVVWIIFDELDYRIAFENRPTDIKMPEFDRLLQNSLYTTNAKSPGQSTIHVIPSLLIGKKLESEESFTKSDILLTNPNLKEPIKFSEEPNLFTKIKKMDGDIGVIGWYHPYCRTFAEYLSTCQWETRDVLNDFETKSLFEAIVGNYIRMFNALPSEYRSLFSSNAEYVRRHNSLLEGSKKVVSNPDIDFSFIHLPVPHFPYRYNRKTDDFSGGEGYIDNLVLTDKVLGELRKKMETANLWDETVVIVSSDHQLRIKRNKNFLTKSDFEITKGIEDLRIPFIVKLKNQNESIKHDKPFNIVNTQDLILKIIRGKISSSDELKEWMNSQTEN